MNIVWIIDIRQQLPLRVLKLIDKIILAEILLEMKRMNGTSEFSIININYERDSPPENKVESSSPSENKDIGPSSSGRNDLISNNAWSNAFVSSASKTHNTGAENGRSVDRISHKPEEFVSHSAQTECECGDSNEEPLPHDIERDLEVDENYSLGTADTLVSDAHLFKNHNTPKELEYIKRSIYGKRAHFEYISDDNAENRMPVPPLCTYLHPMDEHCPTDAQILDTNRTSCSQHSHFKLSEAKKDLSDKFTVIMSQPSDEQMQCILPMCHKEKGALIESPLGRNGKPLDEMKGKERVSKMGGNKSVSMEKDDSHESAESSNSKDPCAKGKRAWSCGQETFTESKRIRKSIDSDPRSGSHIRKNSSFMNWISSVTKGSHRSDNGDKHSLGFIPHPPPTTSSNLFRCPMSNDSNHNAAYRGMGFDSIFQALYCPTPGKPVRTVTAGYQEEYADFRKIHFNDSPAGSVKEVPISSMRNEQGNYQSREPTLAVPSVSLRNSPIQERMKHSMEEYSNFVNVRSSSLSFPNGSSSPSEGKEFGKHGTFGLNKFSNPAITNKAGGFPATLWINRFLPKVAALTPCEKVTDDSPKFLHYSQNEIVSVRDCSNSENVRRSSEDLSPYISGHEYSSSPMDSCGSKNVTKFKLNPILPSQTLKKLEPMTTVFAKRLDAFRHISTSETQDDVSPESATCLFCGKHGHQITACSDVNEDELEDLMQKMNSYGRAEKSSCICIRCFLHDHWAVACPYASFRHHHMSHNTDDIRNTRDISPNNFVRKIKCHGSDTPLINDYDVGTCSKCDNGQGQVLSAHEIPCGKISGTAIEVQTSINVDILDIIDLNGSVLSSYLTKDGLRRTKAKGKQIASSSTKIDPIGKSLVQTIDTNGEPDRQCLIFERIRKLRLSRTEIIRWMGSSISHFSLIGFFLRVKIGRCEENLGGTGYHVACICGAPGQKMYEHSKNHLPVDIGGLRCLIDCRFISNDDFAEDELKAWWSATLRRGGKLPSEEDLDNKLEEREKFDL